MSAATLDLYGAAFRTDPYGELARLRELGWHAQTAIGTAVLRHTEVQQLLQLRTPRADGPADWLPPTEAVYGPTRLPMAYDTG
ncbi:hypothetical protein OHA72_31955 [Dactylosporangium sp. NBC_01737]|uniref:hypothetical protein n=1 Tax=Dactylosporangium sp. NBC_01737 TaxID=2975959 RepID=UPI002E0D86FD|nr:hypothetical protein OHA72_31955 [Dactylosporangium sp. NBC_01737]